MPYTSNERTFVILKPDAVQRSLMGEIIKRFERVGLKLVGIKLVDLNKVDEAKVWEHYNKDDAWFTKKGTGLTEALKNAGKPITKEPVEYGKDIIRALIKYMQAGPVVMMVWQGNQSVAVIKKLVGETEPATSDVGTIRGDFTIDSFPLANVDDRAVRNLVHCSDNLDDAKREIALWFNESEMMSYRLIPEQIFYDVNLDGIFE
jgi:nucleoside-diphosphate kinase